MIVHSCQWEPESPAMSPPSEPFPAKNKRQGPTRPAFLYIRGLRRLRNHRRSPFFPARDCGQALQIAPGSLPRERSVISCSDQRRAEDRRRRGEIGVRSSEIDPGYATDRSEVRSDSEECVRFSIASFNSSSPNGLSRQTSAPASLRFCRAYGLPLMPTT